MKHLLILLSVYSYGVGVLYANNPHNDHPEVSYLLGGFLGTILLIGAIASLIGEKK